jgi:hypothetical protein
MIDDPSDEPARHRPVVRRADLAAMATLLAATAIVLAYLTVDGTVLGMDAAVQFYPLYSYLGERLRAGELPAWNPAQFSGMPFAADPQSGWLYLPAMLWFAALPLAGAIAALVGTHLLLAGLGAYALARALGMGAAGALVAALAYELNGWLLQRVACCPVDVGVAAWLPIALLGVNGALRAGGNGLTARRVLWWGVAGLALCQILSVWLGQGGYYGSLAVVAFVAYRALLDPVEPGTPWRPRLGALLLDGGAIVALGVGLAAAGLLPRLELIELSTLADGYPAAARGDGWTLERLAERLLARTTVHPGGVTLALAVAAPLLTRRRYALPFWLGLAALALLFAGAWRSPLHAVAYALLPHFQDIQANLPSRVLVVFYLPLALLAGATIDAAGIWLGDRGRRRLALVPVAVLLATGVWLWLGDRAETAGPRTLATLAVGGLLLAALPLVAREPARRALALRLLPVLVVGLLLLDLLSFAKDRVEHLHEGLEHRRLVLGRVYDLPPSGAFLRAETAAAPARYIGFDPDLLDAAAGVRYRYQFGYSLATNLLVNNLATVHGLEDVQGGNYPVQLARYAELMTALNGAPQNYHDANVEPAGLASPLLDLLNARYVVVPNAEAADRPDLRVLIESYPTVYQDRRVRILENPAALPRAWIVHRARQVAPGEALPLLASGQVDPRAEALLETPPPPLALASDPARDRATILERRPERLRFRTTTDAPGLLVLSEIAYPAWSATVDGVAAPVHTADHALRAVAIPPGEHVVELRFASATLRAGLVVGGIALAAYLAGLAAALPGWDRRLRPASRSRRRGR